MFPPLREGDIMNQVIKFKENNKIIVTLHNGMEKECDNLHKAILYLIKR